MMLISPSASWLFAQEGPPDEPPCEFRPPHPPLHHRNIFFGNPEILKNELDLSDTQIKKIQSINFKYKSKIDAFRKIIIPQQRELRRLLLSENVKLDQVKFRLKKISEINTEIRFLKIKHRIELEKILTKSQLTRLKEEKRHMRRKMRRGQFHGE